MSHVLLKRMYGLVLSVYRYVRPTWFIVLFKSSVSLLIISSIIANKVLKSPSVIFKLVFLLSSVFASYILGFFC